MSKPLYFRRSLLATGLMLGFALPVGAQNLVQNASFDASSAHWTVVMPSMSMVDSSTGSDAAPSMRVATDNSPTALAQVYSDCIAISDNTITYDLIVDILHESGASEARVGAYTGACLSFLGSAATVTGGGTGWQEQAAIGITLPAGTGGVRVTLQTSGPLSAANFDRVRFGATGTTPVTLQSFDID